MCCIFTCCGWMIDLVQRVWVFVMSCCMCSAVCMSMMTASMSGIAMGYNYSLAEYIDMKETNVSVFLKRGIFDDDLVGDDMGFRRAGHLPVSGLIKESNLVTAEPEEVVVSPRSGRRLDDSVLQSDENNNFEGSLMKLTAKPPAATSPPPTYRGDEDMMDFVKKFSTDSLDQLKAIQSMMNMRKSNNRGLTINYDKTTTVDPRRNNLLNGRRMMIEPNSPDNNHIYIDKAAIPFERFSLTVNPIRTAVPESMIGASDNWLLPKNLERSMGRTLFSTEEYDNVPVTAHFYPKPIRYKTGIERPTLPPTPGVQKPTNRIALEEIPKREMDARRFDNSELNRVKDKLLMDKSMFPSFEKTEGIKSDNQDFEKPEEADYEEEAKRGIRVRKKRNTDSKKAVIKETSYTLFNSVLSNYDKVEQDIKSHNNGKTELKTENKIKMNYIVDSTEDITNRNTNFTDGNIISNTSQYNNNVFNKTLNIVHNDTNHHIKNTLTVRRSVTETKIDKPENISHVYAKAKPDVPVLIFLKSFLN
ncbi:unnamed protein product [Chilo suppressalis]|uniref:Uncharacterized protein n=1 Tax=Chilo suppressalis TaxID=168631 RepID=A0ABN8LA88_CHISP|nr:unnamed protein product [Chilo suppressalis]